MKKLIEGTLVSSLVALPFRVIEMLLRTLHLLVSGIRATLQQVLISRIDRWLSGIGKSVIARRAQIDDSALVVVTDSGEYGGDAKYVVEELLRRQQGARITWAVRADSVGPFPRSLRFVEVGSADFYRTVASARVVLHEGSALDRLGVRRSVGQEWLRVDEASDGVGGSAAKFPRQDVLVEGSPDARAELRHRVLTRAGLSDQGQRFLLFAPQRALEGTSALDGIDVVAVKKELEARFSGTWELLVRAPAARRRTSVSWMAGLPVFCRDVSTYPDLQELLVVADAALSDGASWASDFELTEKPLFQIEPGDTNAQLMQRIAGFSVTAVAADSAAGQGQPVQTVSAAARMADRVEVSIR